MWYTTVKPIGLRYYSSVTTYKKRQGIVAVMSPGTSAPSSDRAILCDLKWVVARHTWSTPIPKADLVRLALDAADQGRGKELCDDLKKKSYITWQRGRGFEVKNSPDEQAKLAVELRDTCNYDEIQIEPRLSRFEQAGGFDAYE